MSDKTNVDVEMPYISVIGDVTVWIAQIYLTPNSSGDLPSKKEALEIIDRKSRVIADMARFCGAIKAVYHDKGKGGEQYILEKADGEKLALDVCGAYPGDAWVNPKVLPALEKLGPPYDPDGKE